MIKDKQESVLTKKRILSNTPTCFSDIVHVGARTDDMIFLQFFSDTPDALVENFKTMIQKAQLTKLMDIIANSIDYYPVKQQVTTNLKTPMLTKKTSASKS